MSRSLNDGSCSSRVPESFIILSDNNYLFVLGQGNSEKVESMTRFKKCGFSDRDGSDRERTKPTG